MSYVLGIDPGITGAVAVLLDGQTVHGFLDVPILQVEVGGKKRKQLDEGRLFHLMSGLVETLKSQHGGRVSAILEHVHAMPKNGSIGNFNLGQSYGSWRMLLAALDVSFEVVPPQRWQKVVIGKRVTDQALVALASQWYPSARTDLYGPMGGLRLGRADALLLARYGSLREIAPTTDGSTI